MTEQYYVYIGGKTEGPYAEAEIFRSYQDGDIEVGTQIKPVSGDEWKSVADILPKKGPTIPRKNSAPAAAQPQQTFATFHNTGAQRVTVVDLDVPFTQLVWLMLKLFAASIPVMLILGVCFFVVMLIFGGCFASMLSSPH